MARKHIDTNVPTLPFLSDRVEEGRFLEQMAEFHLQNYPNDISNICFVFPGRRAGVFFKKYLKEKTKKPIWEPPILTISDFFSQLSGMIQSDNITLLFRLHFCYCKTTGINISIDDFVPFGETILNDFNDIDNYLVDAKVLFSNLLAYKMLEDDFSHLSNEQIEAIKMFWNSFDPEKLSKHQEEFLKIWDKMFELYTNFKQLLTDREEAYSGMIYRTVAEKIKADRFVDMPYKQVVFAGFNLLNKCEQTLFNILHLQGKATFFWDFPPFTNSLQKREYRHISPLDNAGGMFSSPKGWIPPSNKLPLITIISTPNDLAVAQVAASKLTKIFLPKNEIETEKTAIVLADENLLFPVLDSIPDDIKSINITLGYPINKTPAYTLIENILNFQKNVRTTKEGKTWFYHRPLIALLRHQYIGKILELKNNDLIDKLIKSKQIFFEKESLQLDLQTDMILSKIETTNELTVYLKKILQLALNSLSEDENLKLEHEFVFNMLTIVNRLGDALSEHNIEPSPDTWLVLFKRLMEQATISFKGEPVKGLQIMGMQETRLLDFDTIIIPGMNEGIFPKTSIPDSFIPFNLRKGYELPTVENRDAIDAYYFYRLINRADDVYLIYSTTKTVTGEGGEQSRFLQQLYYQYRGEIKIENISQSPKINKNIPIFASKSHQEMLSPSALSTYIDCPLQYYFIYIAKIKEPEELTEDLDQRTFGNLFHKIIETLYEKFIGKEVTASDLKQLVDNENELRKCANKVFEQNIPFVTQVSDTFIDLQGKNILVYEILLKYTKQLLTLEIENTPFILVDLEKKVSMPLTLPNGQIVNIGGYIDRIDLKNNKLRIIDYKTGKTGQTIKNISDLFDTMKHRDIKAVFQTLVYAHIVAQTNSNREIAPCVISLRKLHGEKFAADLFLNPNKNEKQIITYNLVKEEFIELLTNLVDEIISPDIPFKQTENKKVCEYCLFKEYCW